MEIQIIIWLQSIGSPALDVFMKVISYMASWIGAIFLFLTIFILLNKKFGLTFGIGFLCTVLFNYVLKETIKRPRPYVANTEIVNKLQTIGYSMPSGHSVSVIFMALSIIFLFYFLYKNGKFKSFNKMKLRILVISVCIVFVLITIISRMYLGQHYLTDIIVGLLLGSIGFLITYVIFKKIEKKRT